LDSSEIVFGSASYMCDGRKAGEDPAGIRDGGGLLDTVNNTSLKKHRHSPSPAFAPVVILKAQVRKGVMNNK